MLRDLKSRIQDNIKNYKKPTDLEELSAVQLKAFEILNKKAPKKQLTLSEKKLNKAIAILLRK